MLSFDFKDLGFRRNDKSSSWHSIVASLDWYSIAMFCIAIAFCFFKDFGITTDTRENINPIQTWLTTGVMGFPLYGHPEAQYNHPPTYYFFVALICKLGLPIMLAAQVLVSIYLVMAFVILLKGPFGRFEKQA